MIVTYYGVSCFKIQSGDRVLAFDPPSEKSEFKAPRFQAGVVFVSTDQKDHNGFENITSKEGQPFLIDGPGEYETGGMSVFGVGTSHLNTIYIFSFDDLKICYLGVFDGQELNLEAREFLNDIDILFVPVFKDAKKVVGQINPRIVIPMNYDKKGLASFRESFGQDIAPVEKITLKKKDVLGKKEELVILKPLLN